MNRSTPRRSTDHHHDQRHSEQTLQAFMEKFESDEAKDNIAKFCQDFAQKSDVQHSVHHFLSKDIRDHSSNDIQILSQVCHFFLKYYRTISYGPGGKLQPSKFMPTSTVNSMVRQRVSFIQYIPLWISIHLNSRYSNDRDKYQFLDAFLLSIYNSEAEMQTELKPVGSTATSANNSTSSSSQNPLQRPAFVKVPSLASSSIYHDSSQLKSEDKVDQAIKLDQIPSGLVFHFETFGFIDRLTASTRPIVLRLLMQTFNRQIHDVSKTPGLDHFTRSTIKLLERGYLNASANNQTRIPLESPLMMEYLFSAYVCMYNGFQVAGNKILELIHERASLSGCTEVLLLSNAIKSLVLASNPNQVHAAFVSTPVQIPKNTITAGSFRAKKLHTDIAKVQNDLAEDGSNANTVPISVTKNNNMTSIVEEGELSVKIEDGDKNVKTGTETSHKSGFQINKDLLNPKKLKVKLTKKHSISEVDTNLDHHHSATFAGTTSGSDPTLQPLLKTKSSIEKRKKDVGGLFQDKKNKTKEHHRTDSSSKPLPVSAETGNETLRSGTGSTFEPEINQQQVSTSSIPLVSSNLNNGDSISAAASTTSSKEYDTVEKVEELIQMKKLPAETLAIHSPESASTTII